MATDTTNSSSNLSSAGSLQTRAVAGPNLEILTTDLDIVQNRMVFSSVNEEVRAAKTLTLRNTGNETLTINSLTFGDSQEKDNAVRSGDHKRGIDFSFENPTPTTFNLAANQSINLSIKFAPKRISKISNTTTHLLNAENYASLTINSNDPDQQTRIVDLAGVNFANYESANEPSLAEITRIFGWTTNISKENLELGGAKAPIGDEVYSPYWLRADPTKSVELLPIAVTSKRVDEPHGIVEFVAKAGSGGNSGVLYEFAGRANDESPDTPPSPPYTGKAVLGSNALSGGENQKLLPRLLVNGINISPTTDSMGFADAVSFEPTKAFALKNGGQWTDDNKNGTGQLHNWRMFSVRDAKGTLVPNTWIAAHDIGNTEGGFKNYDYNDHVYLLKNAKPESAALDPSVGGLFPGAPGLVFDFNQTTTGGLNDRDGESIGFTSTQLNKNDTFTTKQSYDRSLLDINTSGLGTLTVTTTVGSNGSSENTLVNGLQTTFDGRASKSLISTRLVNPLSSLTLPNQQGGIMFGLDQDNYIKLVARVQDDGRVGLQFYSEKKGIGSTIGSVVPLSSSSPPQSLDLMLLTDPQAGTVRAAYRTVSATGEMGSLVTLPSSVLLKGGKVGQYFAAQSKAGIVAFGGTTPTTITFDKFAIASNETTAARTPIYRLDVAGSDYTESGRTWSSDTGTGFFTSSPGEAIAENNFGVGIANTDNDLLYQTYRAKTGPETSSMESRLLSYNLPVNGKVDVRLHFAEIYFGAPGKDPGGIGKRVFDVAIEGNTVLDNFDITAAAGGALTAVVVPIEGIQVIDGVLNISFRSEVNFGAISGIEVLRSPA